MLAIPSTQICGQFLRTLVKVHFHGKGTDKTIEAKKGENILKIAEENHVPIPMACEGNGACGTCMVYIKKGADLLNEATDAELDVMDFAPNIMDNSRLACRCNITANDGDVDIEIPLQARNII